MEMWLALASTKLVPVADEHKFVTPEVRKHIDKTLNKLAIIFPQVRKYVKAVRFVNSSTSEFDREHRELRISTYTTRGTVAQAQLEQSQGNKDGFVVHNGKHEAFDALINHEFGHAIHGCIVDSMRDDEDGYAAYMKGIRALRDKLGFPSEYAKQNEREWLAEQFTAEWMGKGNGELIRYFLQHLKGI
jgi:hypothetical protein|uniref:Lethal factor n=1 Tax=Myoviridae sp. ctshb19 TaxID=2825194 RepID=A0A8S5UGW9_9CAUD|nr:MAG TPA: Lethal factor [Myoviridae sp. ctshb19]